ncbi:hypothetical protein E2C01_054934 [Portunus trituberculatus]|uniref:Uncharacterized protein n=1 Tax=Portunus trituberculatus TaxID=210409 RepID=A0A5B7GTZ2_PORTR|nr:hypothetical protein [Portunus trituberculatus]
MPGAPGTFGTVYWGGVHDTHQSTMPHGHPTTQETEISICHMAPMPGGQLIIPSHGLGIGVELGHTTNVWWTSPYPEYECWCQPQGSYAGQPDSCALC